MKVKILDFAAIIIMLLLGIVHTALTPVFYNGFNIDALWFAGTGIGFVFLAMLNGARKVSSEIGSVFLSLLANVVALIYCILIVVNLNKPQAYISFVVILSLFFFSVGELFRRKFNSQLTRGAQT